MLSQIAKLLHRSPAERLLAGQAWGLRYIQSEANSYSASFIPLPPVNFDEECGPPTVLQWLRRRGPPVSEACRNRLLRDKKVRILEDGHLRQIRASAALQQGSQLLIPKTAVAQWQEPGTHRIKDARTQMLEDAVVQRLRGSVLHKDRDMLIINKPAGLPVQGGDGIRVSVDSVLPQLGAGAAERPRLVHRLDRNTSGALVLARSRNAATRLSHAFRQASAALACERSAALPTDKEFAGPQVQKLYVAIVEESSRLEDKGFVGPTARQMQVPGKGRRRADGAGLAAEEGPVLTQYTVLARCPERFALLALQPVTGRKHQLRKACARVLQTPIIGDGLYGQTRSAQQLWFNDRLDQQPGQPGDRPEEALSRMLRCNRNLQLHCLQLRIKDAEGFQVEAIAPLPAHMRKAIQMLFRSLPEDLEAQLPRLAQLSDFSTPQSLQDALEKARHSLQSRAHENAAPKRSAVLPRVAHVNLPADPKFEHLAVRSRDENERDTSASDDEDDSSNSDMDSDGEVIDRKARWTSARKKEAKEKRRVLKKARRALQKERREQILAQTPLSWDK